MLARISLSTSNLDAPAWPLIAGFRLVRDPVLPHAWSVFHCVATPRIPVHHAQELPIGGKLPSYFILKSLTQSFPLEWRDVLRYQRLRKLHADLHAANCAPLRDPFGADPARLLGRGGRRRGHDVVLRALDDRVELAALALGHAELREGLVESSMNASHSAPEMSSSRCESSIVRPEYVCGPPAAQQTCSVT